MKKQEKVVTEGKLTSLFRRNSGFFCSAVPCPVTENGPNQHRQMLPWDKNTSLGKTCHLTSNATLEAGTKSFGKPR